MTRTATIIAAAAISLLAGCSAHYKDTFNPSFPVTEEMAQADERRMQADHVHLDRPVLVIGGFRSPDMFIEAMTTKLARMTCGDRYDWIRQPTWFEGDLEDIARRAIDKVQEAYPSDDPATTIEVDVVGYSMGGIVARYAADRLHKDNPGARRLRINRLFTISTPHRGAWLAERTPLVEDRGVGDLYRKSLFLTMLDEAYTGDYPIVPYGRLGDHVVGPINMAPPGRWPIWCSAPLVGDAHLTVNEDRRILTDIARRLRGEAPRGTEGEPLPDFALE